MGSGRVESSGVWVKDFRVGSSRGYISGIENVRLSLVKGVFHCEENRD